MREIKFREWVKRPKRFHFWGFIDKGFISCSFLNNPQQQFTGLKDKNGKEIFEGDIVKEEGFDNKVVRIKEIEWVSSDNVGCGFNHNDDGAWLEVIGNIYENPEMVKKK